MTGFSIVAGKPVGCHRCGQQSALAAWVPHEWQREDGSWTTGGGRRQAPLCQTCDLTDPHAGALALFLRFHPEFTTGGEIAEDALAQFSHLVEEWLPHAKVPVVSDEDFEADIAAWRSGEFDG